jgi:3-oxoacyl-[acyl-carrier-protein] synthase II
VSEIFVCGTGAVSPAGWGMKAFREALARGEGVPTKELPRPGHTPLHVRQVPPALPRPAFLAHARLRRTSSIAHYSVSAALEALGDDAARVIKGELRLGIIYCALTGCVNYSRRFYDEVLKDPSTASPVVFPETVYNSPASHLAALVGTTGINYTLVGDPGTFIQGLVLAADWLTDNRVDGCLVIGAEEMDWLTAGAVHLFERKTIFSDGAGALYLRRSRTDEALSDSTQRKLEPPHVGSYAQLKAVTNAHLFSNRTSRVEAIKTARAELQSALATETVAVPGRALLCDGLQNVPRADRDEQAAWGDWAGGRVSVKTILGEALMASAAWQCIAAVDALAHNEYDAATVSVPGTNQQAIAAQFARCSGTGVSPVRSESHGQDARATI